MMSTMLVILVTGGAVSLLLMGSRKLGLISPSKYIYSMAITSTIISLPLVYFFISLTIKSVKQTTKLSLNTITHTYNYSKAILDKLKYVKTLKTAIPTVEPKKVDGPQPTQSAPSSESPVDSSTRIVSNGCKENIAAFSSAPKFFIRQSFLEMEHLSSIGLNDLVVSQQGIAVYEQLSQFTNSDTAIIPLESNSLSLQNYLEATEYQLQESFGRKMPFQLEYYRDGSIRLIVHDGSNILFDSGIGPQTSEQLLDVVNDAYLE